MLIKSCLLAIKEGCVAKPSGSLVEVAKIPTVTLPTHFVHEPLFPLSNGVTSNRTSRLRCVRWKKALSLELPQSGRNDARTGAHSIVEIRELLKETDSLK